MCGRYAQSQTEAALRPRFALTQSEAVRPTWNAAPAARLPIVVSAPEGPALVHATWGFAPSWAADRLIINARSEDAATKRSFAEAVRNGRCVVPATGFYEWRGAGRVREPILFRDVEAPLWGLAGLVMTEDSGQRRFCILTTQPNALVAPVHDRMPVILPDQAHEQAWLHGAISSPAELGPLAGGRMRADPVSPAVNRVGNDGPELWDRPPEQTSFLI